MWNWKAYRTHADTSGLHCLSLKIFICGIHLGWTALFQAPGWLQGQRPDVCWAARLPHKLQTLAHMIKMLIIHNGGRFKYSQ